MANLMQSLSCQKELKKNVTGRHNVDTSYYPLTDEPHSVEIRTGVNVRWPGGTLQWNRNGWTQSWTQTLLYLQIIHFTSHYTHKSCFFSLLIFRGHSTRNLHPAGWPSWFCWPTQEPVLATANRRSFGEKNAGKWTVRAEISKEEILGSKRSMQGNILAYSRL